MSWSLLIAGEILDSLNLFSYSEFFVKRPFTLGPSSLTFRWSDHVLTFSQSMKIISRRSTDETGLNCGPSKIHHNKLNQMIWIIFDPWIAPSRFETSIFGPSILIVIPSCRALLWFLAFSYQFLAPNFMNFPRNFSLFYFFSSRTFLYWAPIIRIVNGSRKYEQIIINNVKIEEKRDDISAKFSNVSEFLFWASFGIKFNVHPSQIEKITGKRHARVKTSIVDEPLRVK